jgi:hypothetical protein
MNKTLMMIGAMGVMFCASVDDPMARHMTHEEQDRTGVSRLFSGHKEELAQWMDKKGQDTSTQDLSLTLNIKAGEFLQLSDGTIWQVGPCCMHISSTWLTRVDITVTRSQDHKYPYYLENKSTGERIMAHQISHLPSR